MPAPYPLFFVTTWSVRPGKMAEAMQWYAQATDLFSHLPGTKSVRGFANQFGLGPGEHGFEMWVELEAYAALDAWDRIDGPIRQQWLEVEKAGAECLDEGPSRLMGDLAGSVPSEMGGELAPEET